MSRAPAATTIRALACALLCAAAGAAAAPARYAFDPVHTQVLFFADHLGFSHAMGRFTRVDGWLEFDPDAPARTRCDVTVPIDSLWLGDAAWEKKVRSDAFFDAAKHPSMRFVCDRVVPVDARRATLEGRLTLRGVTRPVTFDVRINRVGRHTFSLAWVAGFSARGTIARSAFGMTRMLPAVGDEVEIRLEVEALRQ